MGGRIGHFVKMVAGGHAAFEDDAGWLAAADAFGCPNCKDAVSDADPDGMNLARGYFYSILIMLAMPFALIGSFSAFVWREMRRQKAAGDAAHGDSPS